MLTQSEFECARLHAIVHFCGSSVQVDILNVFWRESRFSERFGNGARGFFRRLAHAHPVEGLTSGRVSGNLRVDASPASASMVVVFQNEHPGALGQNEAITIRGKGTRSALGCVIP